MCLDVLVKRSYLNGETTVPPSKSYTHRAIISASLSEKSIVENPLIADDTLVTVESCRKIGARIVRDSNSLTIYGADEILSNYFNMGNSGTTLRIFLGLLSLCPYKSVLNGDKSLRSRPNLQLAKALRKLGAEIKCCSNDCKPPVWVRGVVKGGKVEIEALSSQYVSSLLMTLPMALNDSEIVVKSVKSRPYIDITLHVLEISGIEVEVEGNKFYTYGEQGYRLRDFRVPSDFTSASYIIAAALISGDVKIVGMFESKQGDRRIVNICREMGGHIRWDKEKGVIRVKSSELEGVEIDASDIPDLVPTIAVLAAVARGRTRIYNAEHLRLKEIDRIEGIYRNLRALGVDVKKTKDGLEIRGGKGEFRGVVDSFGDHRMALAFSILGLTGEVLVRNAEVVTISFPDYFEKLEALGANILRV